MSNINTTNDPINIVIVGVTEIRDELLPKALPLMGRNLNKFAYLQNDYDVMQTTPIWFSFANKPLAFQETGDDYERVRTNMIPHCHGAIISLRMVAPASNYLKHKGWMAKLLMRYNEVVYQAKLPTVCVLEDNHDSFQWVFISDPDLVENPDEEALWMRPPDFVKSGDDLWQPNSSILQATRASLMIPESVPILPYSYRRPASFRNMLTTLLYKINPSVLIQPEPASSRDTKPLKIAVIGLTNPQDRMDRLHDPMLYPALMLMSLNLDEATYHTGENGFDNTPPLRFDFTDQAFVFSRNPATSDIAERIQDILLPTCNGVIVNVYATNSYTPLNQRLLVNKVVSHIYASNLPTIFVQSYGSERTIKEAKQVLNVPEHIPFIPYHYDEPISLQHLLTTLLAEIDKANLVKKG